MIADLPRLVGRAALGMAIASALLWGIGLDLLHAIVLGAAGVALVALRWSPAVLSDRSWPEDGGTRSDSGARREVARLSWSMQGYESRVQRHSVQRLHEIAAFRLARQGLDLTDPRDYIGCESALGVRAYGIISEPEVRPLYADFVAAVAAVEQLDAGSPGSSRTADSTGSTPRARGARRW